MAQSPFNIAEVEQDTASSLWDAGDDRNSKGQSRPIPTGGTQVMFGMQAMIWSRTSQTRPRLIPMDVDWTQDTAADDSEQDTADSAVCNMSEQDTADTAVTPSEQDTAD